MPFSFYNNCQLIQKYKLTIKGTFGIVDKDKKGAIMTHQLFDTKDITLIGLMAALICILAPWTIPLPFTPVPISFATLALYFAIMVVGWKRASLGCLVYILVGIVGLPVFSGFSGGIQKVAGPTGGYLVGYLLLTIVGGYIVEKGHFHISMSILGLVIGTLIMYGFGTAWLSYQMNLTFHQGLVAGVLPYLPGDAIKIAAGVLVSKTVREAAKGIL